MFQIRLSNVQNCLQWTSSDIITYRVEDIIAIITLRMSDVCNCNFSRHFIHKGGFKCFPGSENHVIFRAILRETDQKHLHHHELIVYLERVVDSSQYWLLQGQYLKINNSCSLIIGDIHDPECPQDTILPPLATTTVTAISCYPCRQSNNSNMIYLAWAVITTTLLVIVSATIATLIVIIITRARKISSEHDE